MNKSKFPAGARVRFLWELDRIEAGVIIRTPAQTGGFYAIRRTPCEVCCVEPWRLRGRERRKTKAQRRK